MKLVKVENGNIEIQFDGGTINLSPLDAENLKVILDDAAKIATFQDELKRYEPELTVNNHEALHIWKSGQKTDAIRELREVVHGLTLGAAKYYLETINKF
jgi:hypothetical protein